MLALYRSSRQADALRAYRLLKSRLGEELGIEPSSWIRQLESKIVTGDEALQTVQPGCPCRALAAESWSGSSWVRVARADSVQMMAGRLSRLPARRRS